MLWVDVKRLCREDLDFVLIDDGDEIVATNDEQHHTEVGEVDHWGSSF
jgi:hypothetical protein